MDDETRACLGTLRGWIEALRSAEGFYPGAEGFRIGSTRLLEKLVSHAEHDDEYHLHQRDEDGTESDLTGARSLQGIPVSETDPTTTQILGYNATTNEWVPTAAGAAAAHKDTHDPQDGADPLDTANAAAITGVVGAGTGSSHSLARADHVHAISHSILDNRLATIDGTTNAPANLDYAKWTTLGLEGKTYTQLRADINVADGADVTGDNTPKAHGPEVHTAGYATWKVIHTDAAGDQQEVAVGADGTVFTGTGAASAPAFEAADEHAHANDHAEAHAVASHNDTTATGAELETLTDGSTAGGLHVHVEAEITDLDHLTGAEAITAVEGEATLDLTGNVTIAAAKSLAVDTISEKTGAAGVTIDTAKLKDSKVYPVAGDANMYFGKIGSNFFLQADTGDFIHYNVSLNKWYFYSGDAQRFTVSPTTITSVLNHDFSAGIDVTGDITVTGTVDGVDIAGRDHAEAHGIAAHTGHANWKALYTDGSGDEQELALGADGEVFTSTGAAGVPAFEAAAGGGATVALDNLDTTAVNESIISDTDSTDDLGSAAKYWANVYADKLYLNATATLGGGTAGQVTLTGNLDVSGRGAFGAAASPSAQDLLAVKDTITENVLGYGINVDVKGSRATGAQVTYGVTGKATSQGSPTAIGLAGLFFTASHESSGPVSVFAGCAAVIGSQAAGTGAIGTAQAFFAPAASWSTPKPTVTCGLDIEEQGAAGVGTAYGIRVAQQTGTLAYLMELTGAATFPYLRVLAGAAPGANQTMLYLAEGGYNLRRVQWMDPGAGGVNFAGGERVMVLV